MQENTLFGETPIYCWTKKNADSFRPNTRAEGSSEKKSQSVHKPTHGFIACNRQGGQIQNQTSPHIVSS